MPQPHLVFLGVPFRPPTRRHYDRLKRELEAETPLHLVLADTTAISSSNYLLDHITGLIEQAAGCIFDATGSNPNVSLEVGIAHALGVDFLLALNTRGSSSRPRAQHLRPGGGKRGAGSGKREADRPRAIIADLQGRNRIEYKAYAGLKRQVAERYLRKLAFLQRWDDFRKHHPDWEKPALALFAEIRSAGRVSRPRLEAILTAANLAVPGPIVKALTKFGLVTRRRGKPGGYSYPAK
jgi:hypothetical protein